MTTSEYLELHEHPVRKPSKVQQCNTRLDVSFNHMSRKWFAISMVTVMLVFYVFVKIETQQLNIDFPSITGQHSLIMLMIYGWDPMQDWTNCMSERLLNRRKDWVWDEFDAAVKDCVTKTPVSKIQVDKFGSEEYYRFGVTTKGKPSTLVSIGAASTVAEEALLRSEPGLVIHATNASNNELNASFKTIGRLHLAEFQPPPTFSLGMMSHNQKEFISLVQAKVRRSFIDHLWISAGSFGHEFLSILHRGGPLDMENIEICQVNFEMTTPTSDQLDEFVSFVVKSLQQQRFFFVRSESRNDRYLTYFVNMENAACITRYFLRFF